MCTHTNTHTLNVARKKLNKLLLQLFCKKFIRVPKKWCLKKKTKTKKQSQCPRNVPTFTNPRETRLCQELALLPLTYRREGGNGCCLLCHWFCLGPKHHESYDHNLRQAFRLQSQPALSLSAYSGSESPVFTPFTVL